MVAPPTAERKVRAPEGSVVGNTRLRQRNLAQGLEPQRRAPHYESGGGGKRGNLYAEQG